MVFCSKCGKPIPDSAQFCPSCGSPVHAESATFGTTGGATLPPRSGFEALGKDANAREYWAKRLVAFIIDAIIIGIAVGLVSAALAFYAFLGGPLTFDRFFSSFWTAGLPSALSGLILVVYFAIAESSYGTTIGKSMFSLKVTTDDGRFPALGASFIRNISKIFWALLLLDVVVGLAIEADYKRKLSDKYVKTTVVSK